MKRSKKLSIEDRMIIQACLHDHYTIREIAERLKVHPSTIYRELHRYSTIKKGKSSYHCRTKHFICNTCPKRGFCTLNKTYYDFKLADEMCQNKRRDSRSSPKLKQETIQEIDEIVSPAVRLGQSLHHIYISNPILQSMCHERTIRRLIYRGNLSVRPYELRRYVRFKHSYKKTKEEVLLRDIRVLIGRTYKDFTQYVSHHKRMNIVQYDSVIGKMTDKKTILTITFPKWNFQFGFLIHKGSSRQVISKIKALFSLLGNDVVKKIFPINLCDNGIEFSRFTEIETDSQGERICNTFFTNPYRSTDKAECERNHELLRYILPKGHSLDTLSQKDLDDIFSHINSYVRKSKNDKTPYDLVLNAFGKPFLDAIGIKKIPLKKVKLNPSI